MRLYILYIIYFMIIPLIYLSNIDDKFTAYLVLFNALCMIDMIINELPMKKHRYIV